MPSKEDLKRRAAEIIDAKADDLTAIAKTILKNPEPGFRELKTAKLVAEQFAALAGADGTGRSPIERALVALISPALFPSERAFLSRNTFRLRYRDFDWRLNDLTGGRPY